MAPLVLNAFPRASQGKARLKQKPLGIVGLAALAADVVVSEVDGGEGSVGLQRPSQGLAEKGKLVSSVLVPVTSKVAVATIVPSRRRCTERGQRPLSPAL